MDILAALADEAPSRSTRKCKVARWLEEIPEETPGFDTLVATITTTDPQAEHYRTTDQTLALLSRLGLQTSNKTFGDHRAKRCRCFY